MRSLAAPLAAPAAIALAVAACSTSGSTDGGADATTWDASADASPGPDAGSDSSPGLDASPDASAPPDAAEGGADAGLACGMMGGTYTDVHKACATASDCAMVARGCYCGNQPVIGISKAHLDAAAACELAAKRSCALGCPVALAPIAEDGRVAPDGGTIEVRCAASRCTTFVP